MPSVREVWDALNKAIGTVEDARNAGSGEVDDEDIDALLDAANDAATLLAKQLPVVPREVSAADLDQADRLRRRP
jgi:hypothetical protein